MNKITSFFLFLVLLCNPMVLLAQIEPEEIKTEGDKFQDYFYESLLQKGIENYDKAIKALEECAKLKPNDAVIYFEMGKNFFELKEYEKAYNFFEKATQIDPKNKWIWERMYDVNYITKNYNQAIITINKLIEFDEVYKDDLVVLYLNTQQFDKALVLINELNEKIGKSEKRDLYKAQILSQGKYQKEEAANLMDEINKNPKVELNYIVLIKQYLENNENEKALELTKKLETEIPTSEWAQVSLFKYYLQENQAQKAIKTMNVVLASGKIDAKIKDRMLNEFLIYTDKNPQYAPDLEKAIAYFDSITDVDIAKEIGKYYHNKKQWSKAIQYYELALKNNSDPDVEANLLLFQSYVEMKEFELLAKKASVLIETYPTQPQFYYFSGLANNQLKQFKKAKEILEMGIDYLVDDVTLEINFNVQLGEANGGLGDSKKKEFYFSKADQLVKNKK